MTWRPALPEPPVKTIFLPLVDMLCEERVVGEKRMLCVSIGLMVFVLFK